MRKLKRKSAKLQFLKMLFRRSQKHFFNDEISLTIFLHQHQRIRKIHKKITTK